MMKLTILIFSVLMAMHEFGEILIATLEITGEVVPAFVEGISGLFEMAAALFFFVALIAGDRLKKLRLTGPF